MKEQSLSKAWQLFNQLDAAAVESKISQTQLSQAVILLSIAGAFTVCLAQMPSFINWKEKLTVTSAIVSALAAFATTRMMHSKSEKSWQNIRAVSEQVRSEIYMFRTGFGKYFGHDDIQQAKLFNSWMVNITAKKVIKMELTLFTKKLTPPSLNLPISDYIKERLKGQIIWYNMKAEHYKKLVARFNYLMQALTIIMILLGAFNMYYGNNSTSSSSISRWVAFFTTLVSSVSAHMMASKYKELGYSYSESAVLMATLESDFTNDQVVSNEPLSAKDVVEKTEAILLGENSAWQGMW